MVRELKKTGDRTEQVWILHDLGSGTFDHCVVTGGPFHHFVDVGGVRPFFEHKQGAVDECLAGRVS